MSESSLVSLEKWIRELGVSRTTAWKWRKKWDWFKTITIVGKVYLHRDVIREFEDRATRGELDQGNPGTDAMLRNKQERESGE